MPLLQCADEAVSMLEELAASLPPLPERLMVGLSGGADSVALFRALLVLRDRRQMELSAVHVNHGLRSEASDKDEQFVRALCERYDVPLYVYRATPPAHAGEGWAREARYAFFCRAVTESGAEALALAHHLDDQAETVLEHLLRGTGLTGLAGMAEEATILGMRVVRPLLRVRRSQLRLVLSDEGQEWREDETNQRPMYLRNRVRLELLPLMENLAHGATERIAQTACLLRADADALDHEAEKLLADCAAPWRFPLNKARCLDRALISRALRMLWRRAAGASMRERELSQAQTASLMSLLNASTGSRINLPGGWHAVAGYRYLHMLPSEPLSPPPAVPLAEEFGSYTLGEITLRIGPSEGTPGDGVQSQELPVGWLRGCELRTKRVGDRIRPFGAKGARSLQDYLTDRRIDAPFRGGIPLVCRGQEVLLICGVGAGDIPVLSGEEPTIRLTWHGDLPWRVDESD